MDTYDSDEDTGYGESEDSDNEERHTWEAENSSRKACSPSVTASSNPMEQPDWCTPLFQEGCGEDQQGRSERQPETRQNSSKEAHQRKDVTEEPAEDGSTRKERDVAKKVATRRDDAGTTTSHGTDESQLETQGTQDISKGDVASPDEARKIDP